jgi:hypothetical protein
MIFRNRNALIALLFGQQRSKYPARSRCGSGGLLNVKSSARAASA